MSIPLSEQNGGMDNLSTSSLRPTVRAIASVGIVLTTVFTALRLVTKRSYSCFHVEDYLSMCAWLLANSYFAVMLVQTDLGLGQHVWLVNSTTSVMVEVSKLGYAADIFYGLSLAAAKSALLLQLQRIFSPHKTGVVYIMTQILIWLNVAAYFGCLIAIIVQCVPVVKTQTPTMNTNHSFFTILIASGAVNIASDVLIIVLPLWAIYHLKISMKKRLAASAMFATGALSFACSILREIYSISLPSSVDITYDIAKMVLTAWGEVISIILCTSLPLMPRFLHMVTDKCETSSSPRWMSHFYTSRVSDSDVDPRGYSYPGSCTCQKEKATCRIHKFSAGSQTSSLRDRHSIDDMSGRAGSEITITNSQSLQNASWKEHETAGKTSGHAATNNCITVQREFLVEHGVVSSDKHPHMEKLEV